MSVSLLDEILKQLDSLPEDKRLELIQQAKENTKDIPWLPNPGPQTEAYNCEADELLMGGQAGGGKSDLLVGLSLTAHKRSLILRRTNKESEKLVDRYIEILGTRDGWNGQEKTWRIGDRVIDIAGCQHEWDKQKWKGIPHSFKGFDEVVDFTESQYVFIIGWNRSADPKERCRVVATTNPPTTPEGLWVVKRWAAWLDPNYPRPAKSGELRWFTTIEGRDTEVDGPGPHMVDGKPIMAKSRCFIRSTLDDNPDLKQSGYDSVLAGLPKELREAYREGKFDTSLKDQPFQCIPTDWVRLAMARWKDKPPHLIPMCAIGVDASGGGTDPMVIAPRYDGYYPELIKVPGESIPTDRAGKYCAGIIVSHRRDNAVVGVDMGGGYGNGIYEQLKENQIEVFGHKGAESSVRRTKEGQLKFVNKRTEVYWRFREALDPSQPGGSPISLPDDSMLLADLTAPTFEHGPNGIKLENKDSICDRLGRSPDDGDAVVIAWSVGPTYITNGGLWEQQRKEFRVNKNPQVIMGRVKRRK